MEEQTLDTTEVTNKYFDRDLSWLTFNYRVLKEAQSNDVPLFERLKFLAIYSSNQDEFFRVRVANLRNYIKLDKKKINKALEYDPKALLTNIHARVQDQMIEFGETLRKKVLVELEKNGVFILAPELLNEDQKAACLYFFKTKVLSFLQPYIFGYSSREPFLNNRELYFALRIQNKFSGNIDFAYLNIPSNRVARFFQLPSPNVQFHYMFLDDIIRMNLDFVFPDYDILECQSIKMNKDADLNIEDEFSGDLVEKIQKQIERRNVGVPARFLYDTTTSADLLSYLKSAFDLMDEDLVPGGHYHSLFDFFQLPNPIGKSIEFEPMTPLRNVRIDRHRSIFSAIDEKDQMLHFPYHTYNYILQFFNQAAIDPHVSELKVTFYRMASDSLIGNALMSAAKNEKKVTVFMELKARFDEENNLRWAERMQKAGVKIIYSIPGLKVHAKVALVKKKTETGMIKNYCFFGTGNLNEKTASMYADHGLLTCDKEMGEELDDLFKYLYKRKDPGAFKSLLVSQFNIIDGFVSRIDREIANARQGKEAYIIIKLNNLEEKGMIDKLYEASRAGVKIDMIIRSICCLIPGVPGMSENITIRRIVGRFLEHGRIIWFHNDGKDELFMGSADWMKRNLKGRIEVKFPIKDKELRNQVKELLRVQLKDNTKAVMLDQNINNIPIKVKQGQRLYNAQMDTYSIIKRWEDMG
ncbi:MULTISPECIES: polyphosphate kinase 1 [Reichenbachiella]|uniref:polyphosphate kinase 1 n=1 Tax=Reichenbachiella TaxID=156993 RepID=UPI0009325C85|nr:MULTISPECIES: polyphosphate kinase 1 [Reichenbachiella]MBU2914716.1 polyphosphate kinase 1 [Reichenbachiella agariperforans]RJE71636.1 polyphosphate kinase 1 [Reichenbachiella sp. MSK19-1]